MPPKQQLDKAAWQWAETTDPKDVILEHVLAAYRLNLKPCRIGTCKRNCKGNPLCLNALGERVWFGKIDDDNWHQIEDPNYERRDDDMFVGLKNLGATCYVNTFLQLWFNNPAIRNALYRFREPDEVVIRDVTVEWSPSSIGGHLQTLFALLALSERKYLDPKDFITHLGLDAGQQQDAQEFSNLFLTLLEDGLSRQTEPSVRNVIQNQFRGEYAYVTTCSRCGTKSERPSTFYELDLSIKGHKTLDESLKDFLQEEKLDGENQYMCSSCNSKQNAARKIHLKHLPPVLNLQLLRFVFDKKTGMKKKLNSFIQFPEVIDMSKYLSDYNSIVTQNSVTYNLSAVLIHRGPTAYSGHYIAHIKDNNSKNWYKFNDEDIEKMKGNKLQLGTEDDPEETGAKQKGRCPKGYHSSRNAYMLVYTLNEENISCSEAKSEAQSLLPAHVLDYVIKDNETFENWVSELILIRDQNIESGKEKQEEIKDTYQKLAFDKLELNEGEWMSQKWIGLWLSDPAKAPPVDNKEFLCKHDKLSPDAAMKLKFVNLLGSESLCNRYEGGLRLVGAESLCMLCVQHQCHVIRTKIKMTEDDKLFSAMTKTNNIAGDCYWVGKASFRSWKKMVLEQLGESEDDKHRDSSCSNDGDTLMENGAKEVKDNSPAGDGEKSAINGGDMKNEYCTSDLKCESAEEKASTSANVMKNDEESFKFNEDILCEAHDQLDPNMTGRKLVPAEVWNRLKQYFPNCPEFAKDDLVCEKCNEQMRNEQQTKEYLRRLAQEQKHALSDLLNDRKRPITLKRPLEVYVLNRPFLEEWKKFIKDPMKNPPIQDIGNTILICEHGGYLYPHSPGQLELYVNDNFVYTWSTEWEKISRMFNVDYEISIVSYEDDDKNLGIVTLPHVCEECVASRINQEENAKFDYDDAIVFVRKIPKQTQKPGSTSVNSNESENSKDFDPDFNQHSSKKRGSTSDPLEEPAEKAQKMENGTRKSQRHRKVRGEKEVKVKSSQTLKELKLQLMKVFSVPPFDQTLQMNGHFLADDSATLGSLKVAPGSVIMLQADEPVEDLLVLQDMIQVSSGPESGFKGTGLLGN